MLHLKIALRSFTLAIYIERASPDDLPATSSASLSPRFKRRLSSFITILYSHNKRNVIIIF